MARVIVNTKNNVFRKYSQSACIFRHFSSETRVFSLNKKGDFRVTKTVMKEWDEKGYIIVRSLLNPKELSTVTNCLENSSEIKKNSYTLNDGEGRKSRLCLWNQPGEDITGMIARSEKVAGTMEILLGGEVYHYHTKLMMKEAKTGGSFVWHQDYGYWYQNGNLFPFMGTAFIAIDRCDTENGCMQVLRGSHKMGRINHGFVGGQSGADITVVDAVSKIIPLDYVILDPGDTLFFHANLLHRSDRNDSDRRRWAILMAYNRASNNPVKKHHHPHYSPLVKVSNSAILSASLTNMMGKDFLNPQSDETVRY